MTPLTIDDAYEMARSIKGYKILNGVRGQGSYDINALTETLVRVSEFAGTKKVGQVK